jgi:hypothetical protein
MRRPYCLAVALLAIGPCTPVVVADGNSPDPLRLIPKQADLVLKVDSPRMLADAIASVEPLRQLAQFAPVREALDSTNFRRFRQLIDYYEKELGASWRELLDRVAGGGVALAVKFEGGPNAPVLLVVQGRDAALTKQAFELVLGVIEQELARQEVREKPVRETYQGIETIRFNPKTHVALAGSAVLVSNQREALERAIDLHTKGGDESLASLPGPADARKLLDPDPLVWMWIDLKKAHESPMGKEAFALPKGDPGQLILFGGLLDVVGHSPFVAIGIHQKADAWRASFRLASGRDATPDDLALHLAPDRQPGCLPLLEPANVLYSTSFYLDLGKLWNEREKLLTEPPRKQFDKAEQQIGRFLAGRKLSELLNQSGPYKRFVATAQIRTGYAKFPEPTIPAFALVTSTRDPEFAKAMEAILRVVALLTGTQAKLKLAEETVDGVKLVGYRFAEDATLNGDPQNLRFNFSPCFAAVGDQFFAASTIELGRELVKQLQKPSTAGGQPTVATRSRLYSAGGAALLEKFEDRILTQAILDRAIPVDEAKRDAATLIDWVRRLGDVRTHTDYRPHEFRFEIEWKPTK